MVKEGWSHGVKKDGEMEGEGGSEVAPGRGGVRGKEGTGNGKAGRE